MKLSLAILALGALFLAGCVGFIFVTGMPPQAPEEPIVEEATGTEEIPLATLTEEGLARAPEPGCVVGVPGPASTPLTGEITAAMKEAAVAALLARETLFLESDAACLRTYELTLAVNPEGREEIEKQTDKQIRATALMMALIMDLPEPEEVRALMLKEDTAWEYKEGEVTVNVTLEDQPEKVVGRGDDDTPLYGADGGWGTTIFYRDGRWY